MIIMQAGQKVLASTRMLEWFLADTMDMTVPKLKNMMHHFLKDLRCVWQDKRRRHFNCSFVVLFCEQFYAKAMSKDWAGEVELLESYNHFKEIVSTVFCGMKYDKCLAIADECNWFQYMLNFPWF